MIKLRKTPSPLFLAWLPNRLVKLAQFSPAGLALAICLGGWFQPPTQTPDEGPLGVSSIAPSEQPETGRVSGTATFLHDGQPVPDFRASFRAVGPYAGDLLGVRHGERRFVGTDGAFDFQGLINMNYVVEVSAKGYVPARSAKFTVSAGQLLTEIHVGLGRGASISGRLVDQQSGKPIVGALVQTVDNAQWLRCFVSTSPLTPILRTTTPARTHTDKNGAYTLDRLSNATYTLQFDHPNYPREVAKNITVIGEEVLKVKPVQVPNGAVIEGIVHGLDGEPIVDARIRLVGDRFYTYKIRTNMKGHYTLKNVYPGTYRLSAMRAQSADLFDPLALSLDIKNSEVLLAVKSGENRNQDLSLLP